jgi:hypothetical protein
MNNTNTPTTATTSTRLQMWAALATDRHFSAYGQNYSGLHPDERSIRVPSGLLDEATRVASKEVRKGRGYVLPDGVWYDPEDGTFWEVVTED